MKKIFILTTNLLFVLTLMGQKFVQQQANFKQLPHTKSAKILASYYYQDFEDSTNAAQSMTFIDGDKLTPHYPGMETWIVSSHGYALSSSYIDNGNKTADDWIITPQITVGDRVYISWDAMAFDSQFADGYRVYISTTGRAVPSDFTEIYSVAAEKAEWTHHIVDITSLTANKNIYVAFQNNSTDKYLLAMDNISVYNPNDVDVSLKSVDLNDFEVVGTKIGIKLELENEGANKLTQVDIAWQLENGEIHTNTIKNLDLSIGESYKYSHNDSVIFNEGNQTIKIWLENPNGVTDQNNENDTINFALNATSESGDRKILLEHFTQASCGPCAQQNPSFFALIFNTQNKNNVAHISYHTSWPGTDPMYNFNETDVDNRVKYYGVNGVPDVIMAGNHAEGGPTQIHQSDLNNEYNSLAIFKLSLDYRFVDNDMEISLKAKALTDITKYDKVMVRLALVEDKTYSSAPGTNGEKSFPNVMRKMFPSYDGSEWKNVMKNDSIELNFTYTVPSEIDTTKCSLVAFIQNDVTKDIYAVNTSESDVTMSVKSEVANRLQIYPNPAFNILNINAISFKKIEIIDLNGRIVLKKEFQNSISELNLNISNLNKGFYLLKTYSQQGISQTKFIKK